MRIFQFTYPTGSNQPSGITFVAAVPDPTQVQQSPESPYHRRDFTLQTSLDASGNPRLIAYGGVFKGGRKEGFLGPVFISPDSDSVTLTDNVGYVVGGIAATAPYASTQGTSCASGTIYSVTLNPGQATNAVVLAP